MIGQLERGIGGIGPGTQGVMAQGRYGGYPLIYLLRKGICDPGARPGRVRGNPSGFAPHKPPSEGPSPWRRA
jgi:hypothetical protein